jgi:zinc-binding alcohol dehydrogenase family protein
MKAIGFRESLPVDHPEALIEFDAPVPEPGPQDLRVAVRAVAVNPVDTKIRRHAAPTDGARRILGWDAVGIVDAVGSEVSIFKPGDRVWYAGALDRPGCNAEFQCVDARLVSHAPHTLSDPEAAALPLTAITAWELLFDRLGVPRGGASGRHLLVTGAAGGVGSILIQLAHAMTRLTVLATASRERSRDWLQLLGANRVLDHTQPLAAQALAIAPAGVEYIASLTHTDQHYLQLVEALAPEGHLALIDDPEPIDVRLLKRKSASLHWEFMFTRSMFNTPDIGAQGALLQNVAERVDAGELRSTLGQHFCTINADNLRRAHALLESGRAVGKIVLEGFG